jgi:hypothetical protein
MIDPFLTARGILGQRILNDELLDMIMATLKSIDSGISPETLDQVRRKLEATVGISMSAGEGISNGRMDPWLADRKAAITWEYWESYKNHLISEGYSLPVIQALDEDTDNILTECGNPNLADAWTLRGLVMGDVQSGKTGNYTGLIAKASDAGYKVIILLTGTIEELRSQTQARLDEGFVGKNSRDILGANQTNTRIGAGHFRLRTPNVLTSVSSDFLTSNGRALRGIPLENINEPALFVIKKNKAALSNCISFFATQLPPGQNKLNVPLLVIDDEADNASVNARTDDDPATINKLIRDLLSRFRRTTYVAYTATPFANVFINPDIEDLFPSDFIYALNPPNNYVGVGDIFTDAGKHSDQVEIIDDAESVFPFGHKKEILVSELPSSLKAAIQTFFLSCAVRDLRQESLRHRTMLVNVSRFTNVQAQISDQLKNYLNELGEEIKQYASGDRWASHRLLKELHETWIRQYASAGFDWNLIRKSLHEATASVKVITINQTTAMNDRLNYNQFRNTEKGRRAVAVGGLTLSRGLTLEGLCVSYFYRDSRAYDTLLQMGRWFGYRPNYSDLFRIWIDDQVGSWFGHIANVIAELRSDLRRMHANRLPPSHFGIRVRSKADTLLVTALNKMRNAEEVEHRVSFSGYGAETPFLPKDEATNFRNVEAARAFLGAVNKSRQPLKIGTRHLWSGVARAEISSFLSRLSIESRNIEFITDVSGDGNPLIAFIGSNTIPVLEKWDVCVPSGDGCQLELGDQLAMPVKCRQRQFEDVSNRSTYLKLNRQRVGEAADEGIGIQDLDSVKTAWEEERRKDVRLGESISGYFYRRFRSRPLLTINFIEPISPKKDQAESKRKVRMMPAEDIPSKVLIAVSLSFPEFEAPGESATVPYRLNRVALRKLGLITDFDDAYDD